MKRQGNRILLQHMLHEIDYIIDYVSRVDYEMYNESLDRRYALVRSLEILGEAANHLGREYHNLHPEIEWKDIVGNRNFLIHDYAVVDYDVVWDTAVNDVPKLRDKVFRLLQMEQ